MVVAGLMRHLEIIRRRIESEYHAKVEYSMNNLVKDELSLLEVDP